MYAVLKNYLTHGSYYLDDAMGRIDYAVGRGLISIEEAAELTNIAKQRASAPSVAEAEIAALRSTVEAQQAEIELLKAAVGGTNEVSTVPEEPIIE